MSTANNSRRALINAAIVIVVGVIATTLAQPAVLARIPLQNLLKNELHADRAANAAFFFWVILPWYLKPVSGILTDAFPLFGSRRKNYMAASTLFAVLAWIGLYFTPHTYSGLLWVCMVINVFMVIASTVVGAYMVEIAQAASGSGRLTAVREFTQQACVMVQGPAGGFLAAIAFGWTAVACGGIMFLLFPAALWFLHEKRVKTDSRLLIENAGKQLVKIGAAKTMWAAVGLMALFYIAPGISTALFYRQQNLLHLNTEGQGFLQFLSGVGGILAAFGYGFVCRYLNLRKLLFGCLIAATVTNLGYMFYSSVPRARVIDGVYGFGYTLAELALMDLAVRATPAGSEGLGFSLMMSVRNIALYGSDWFGSKLLETHVVSFNALVVANSITTFIAVPLIFLLPIAIISKKDAEPLAEAPEPRGVQAVTEQAPR